MAKWKIEVKGPFGGYTPDWFNDSNNLVGSSNQATLIKNVDITNLSYITQSKAQTTWTNNSQLDTFLHASVNIGATGSVLISSTELLRGDNFDATTPNLISNASWPHALTTPSVYRANRPAFNVIRFPFLVSSVDRTLYFYNRGGSGEIGVVADLAGTPAFDDDWGSTVPSGAKALQYTFDAGFPVAKYKLGVVFGNGQYLGKTTFTALTSEFIYFGGAEYVYDIEELNGYLYVITNDSFVYSAATQAKIYLFENTLADTEPKDSFKINAFVSAAITLNNKMYLFYRYANSTDNWIGVLNGNTIEDIRQFDGELPTPQQVEVYNNGISWTNGTKVYHLHKPLPGSQWELTSPITPKYAISTCLFSGYNKLFTSSTNGSGSFDISTYATNTVDSQYETVETQVSTLESVSNIYGLEVITNPLASGARCDISIYINQSGTASKTLTVSGTGKTRHVFRNIDISGVESYKLKFDWTNGSTTNLCKIRKHTIYGNTTTK